MHPVDAHKNAVQAANKAVPEFKELDTPEHHAWLDAYEKALVEELCK